MDDRYLEIIAKIILTLSIPVLLLAISALFSPPIRFYLYGDDDLLKHTHKKYEQMYKDIYEGAK